MTVHVDGEVIHLSGRCQAEDAENLLVALQDEPMRAVDLSALRRMHLAVAQVLLVARPLIRGTPQNEFFARHLINLLQ